MNRSEIAVTLIGLVATFLMPWPGSESASLADPAAVRAEVQPARCIGTTTAPAEARQRIVPEASASTSRPLPGRG